MINFLFPDIKKVTLITIYFHKVIIKSKLELNCHCKVWYCPLTFFIGGFDKVEYISKKLLNRNDPRINPSGTPYYNSRHESTKESLNGE